MFPTQSLPFFLNMQIPAKILLQAAIINTIDWVTETANFPHSSEGQEGQGQVTSQFGVSENLLPGSQVVPFCISSWQREKELLVPSL